ncbi:MAG: recombinase RecQ [Bacteroidetes bacterium MED-G17]|nr:MAG: hypothetical protein CBB99_04145 [Bacteroidetes bacterium TMED39]PDH52356.1 MAG: recombinase RecQ [Bacteroidetes bacterium MED-G17]
MTALEILHKHWSYEAFRPLQEDIIKSILEKRDTVALLPTGGGKSICYQIPALMFSGYTLVVSPLIALMQNQVAYLHSKGIKAIYLHANLGQKKYQQELENIKYGKYTLVYISPERLENKLFQEFAKNTPPKLLAIDEAHCISQWGHDFRPSYRKIKTFRRKLENCPCIALTASATSKVCTDITEQLELKEVNLFTNTFFRPNLKFGVETTNDKSERILWYIKKLKGIGLIYVNKRAKTEELSQLLEVNGISSNFYHAGLDSIQRQKILTRWLKNQYKVLVCTNAFGMGIDKPDVRFVLHYQAPQDIESYYQEAGRAGRDGKQAYCVVFQKINEFKEQKKISQDGNLVLAEISKIYHALFNYNGIANHQGKNLNFKINLDEFSEKFGFFNSKVLKALRWLEINNHLIFKLIETKKESSLLIDFLEDRKPKPNFNFKAYLQINREKKQKLDRMAEYLNNQYQCRNKIILAYFNQKMTADCMICDICVDKQKTETPSLITLEKVLLHPKSHEEIQRLFPLVKGKVLKDILRDLESEGHIALNKNMEYQWAKC